MNQNETRYCKHLTVDRQRPSSENTRKESRLAASKATCHTSKVADVPSIDHYFAPRQCSFSSSEIVLVSRHVRLRQFPFDS